MRVISLSEEAFEDACARLREGFERRYGIPDMIVGIATGGEYVARRFARPSEPMEIITRRRLGSGVKNSFGQLLLRRMPRFFTDFLRMAESRLYQLRWVLKGKQSAKDSDFRLPEEVAARFRSLAADSLVAIVDDAADSGSTLLAVRKAIERVAPGVRTVGCVITVTRAQADSAVDFALWRDRTLIRFPWAADF